MVWRSDKAIRSRRTSYKVMVVVTMMVVVVVVVTMMVVVEKGVRGSGEGVDRMC